jgi:hypothetical protein
MKGSESERLRESRLRGLDRALEICEEANIREEPFLSATLVAQIEEVLQLYGVILAVPLKSGITPTEAHDRILDAQEAYRRQWPSGKRQTSSRK